MENAKESMLSPDFSSLSNFPRRAFTKHDSNELFAPKRRTVRFAPSPNDEFLIQPRHSQRFSVSIEDFMNRIIRLRREIVQTQCEIIEMYTHELKLEGSILELQNCESLRLIHSKKVISALESRCLHLDEDMLGMRLSMLRMKSKSMKLKTMLKQMSKETSFPNFGTVLWHRTLARISPQVMYAKSA